jgi:hypothetical protein
MAWDEPIVGGRRPVTVVCIVARPAGFDHGQPADPFEARALGEIGFNGHGQACIL